MASKAISPTTLPEVAEQAGIEYRTLKTWVDRGLLGDIERRGAGRPSFLTNEQVALARELAHFRRNGLSLDALALVSFTLRKGTAICPICAGPLSTPHLDAASQPTGGGEGR